MKKSWKSHFHKHNLMKSKQLMFLTLSIMKLVKKSKFKPKVSMGTSGSKLLSPCIFFD